ncbi:MAG TPA: hypothetical protein P5081_03980 [Phycisphaerae bacterium]|nr:hypothetical protein [Phycisphaerae bacterium]HRW52019.1 hypothetical protein [Phycisphaerae bacterium]
MRIPAQFLRRTSHAPLDKASRRDRAGITEWRRVLRAGQTTRRIAIDLNDRIRHAQSGSRATATIAYQY